MSDFRIVRKDNGYHNPQTGVVSQHRTLAALAARSEAGRLPYEAQELINGEWVRIDSERLVREQYRIARGEAE
jgi:hypothetical protein